MSVRLVIRPSVAELCLLCIFDNTSWNHFVFKRRSNQFPKLYRVSFLKQNPKLEFCRISYFMTLCIMLWLPPDVIPLLTSTLEFQRLKKLFQEWIGPILVNSWFQKPLLATNERIAIYICIIFIFTKRGHHRLVFSQPDLSVYWTLGKTVVSNVVYPNREYPESSPLGQILAGTCFCTMFILSCA